MSQLSMYYGTLIPYARPGSWIVEKNKQVMDQHVAQVEMLALHDASDKKENRRREAG